MHACWCFYEWRVFSNLHSYTCLETVMTFVFCYTKSKLRKRTLNEKFLRLEIRFPQYFLVLYDYILVKWLIIFIGVVKLYLTCSCQLFHKIALLLLFKAFKVSGIFAVDDDKLQRPKQKGKIWSCWKRSKSDCKIEIVHTMKYLYLVSPF